MTGAEDVESSQYQILGDSLREQRQFSSLTQIDSKLQTCFPSQTRDLEGLVLTARTHGGPVQFHSLQRRTWQGIVAEYARPAVPTSYEFRIRSSSHWISLCDLNRIDGETIGPEGQRHALKNLRDKLNFMPAGGEVRGWSALEKSGCFTSLMLDVCATTDGSPNLSGLRPMLAFEDATLRSLLAQMRSIAIDPSLAMAGYAETIGLLVPFELARIQSVRQRKLAAQGGLTPRQLRLVIDYMEDHIAKSISIAELAGMLGLSRFHFIRAFKKTAGSPPHRYFQIRRVERAKDLLRNSRLSVTEVSEMTGFGSTTHLTRAFRKAVGVNPSTFRRDTL